MSREPNRRIARSTRCLLRTAPADSSKRDAASGAVPHDLDDEALMQRIAARDQAAFDELYERYSGYVFNLCQRVLQGHPAAEEAVVDTFLEVWRKPDRFDPERGSVLTYLLILARCRAIDRHRAEITNRRRETSFRADRDHRQTPTNGPDGFRGSDESTESLGDDAMLAAFDRLAPKSQEVVRLCIVQGLTMQQAARTLHEPLGTIKSRVRNALIQMRQLIRTR